MTSKNLKKLQNKMLAGLAGAFLTAPYLINNPVKKENDGKMIVDLGYHAEKHTYTPPNNSSRLKFLQNTIDNLNAKNLYNFRDGSTNLNANPKLIQAHYLSALQHHREGDTHLAETHLEKANDILSKMIRSSNDIQAKNEILGQKIYIYDTPSEQEKLLKFYEQKLDSAINEIYGENSLTAKIKYTRPINLKEVSNSLSDINDTINTYFTQRKEPNFEGLILKDKRN